MPTQVVRLCETCGAALPADARFCETCGKAVADLPASMPESPPPPAPAPDRPRSSPLIWMALGIGIALVIACGAGGILLGGYTLLQGTQSVRAVASVEIPSAPTLSPWPYPTPDPSLAPAAPATFPADSALTPLPDATPDVSLEPATATPPADSSAIATGTTPPGQLTATNAPLSAARDYDLYVRRIDYQPANPVAGQSVRFNVMIATDIYPAGGPLFPTTRVRWRPSGSAVWSEALCTADTHYAKCDSVFEFTYAQPGTYAVTVEVDHPAQIAEMNELNNSHSVTVTVSATVSPTATPKAGPKYSAVTFSSEFDENRQLPVNPGKTFPFGVKIIYAYWTYSGATPNTAFDYDWYRDGQRVDGSGERFTQVSGKAFQWLNYGYQPKDPLDPGNYQFVVRVNGTIILKDTFVIQAPSAGGPIAGALSVYFTIQNGSPTGWVYDKQGVRHTPQSGTIGGIHLGASDRIVLQTDQARFSLLFDCSTTPGTFNPCDFVADSTANLPKEIRAVKRGMSAYLNISRADNWAGVRPNFPSQRYPADPILRISFTVD